MNVESLTKQQEFLIKSASAKQNLAVFTERLGYENSQFQKDWYHFLQTKFCPFKHCITGTNHRECTKRYILLWPRGHAKTECTAINYVSWLVGLYPDIHISIVTKTATLAEQILLALKTRFESDERYIEIFGEIKPKDPKLWAHDSIIVKRREISKNPTIKAVGFMATGGITGGRSDLIIADDLIDEDNVTTPYQIEKAKVWFNKILLPTLYPNGACLVTGTRWHYADLYSDLLQLWANQVRQAIQLDEKGNETERVLWPEYWTLEKLLKKREEIGTIIFQCQYQNDPTGMEGTKLKSMWLHPWTEFDLSGSWYPPAELPNYAAIDPSLGEADFFGISTLSYDETKRQGYLRDVWCKHTDLPTILKQVIPELNALYHYQKIYMETNFWQKLLTKMPELQAFPIVPVQTVKNKEQRFIPMSAHFESKRILVNPRLRDLKDEFYVEWVQFPRGQHDDALDCVEMVVSNVLANNTGPLQVSTGPSIWS